MAFWPFWRGLADDGGKDFMTAARKESEAAAGCLFILGFGEDAPPSGHNRISPNDKGWFSILMGVMSGFCAGKPERIGAGELALMGGLIQIGWADGIWLYPDLAEESDTARGGGGQHKGRPR